LQAHCRAAAGDTTHIQIHRMSVQLESRDATPMTLDAHIFVRHLRHNVILGLTYLLHGLMQRCPNTFQPPIQHPPARNLFTPIDHPVRPVHARHNPLELAHAPASNCGDALEQGNRGVFLGLVA
jgi:hypothetical protein